MTLIYRFKKERLESGDYVSRPRILVELSGSNGSIIVPALIDTGCDTSVIPKGVAKAIGLNLNGEKHKMYAYRESNDVIISKATITFLGKEERQKVKLSNISVLIALEKESLEDEQDIILGITDIFDNFEITFKKPSNRIIFKEIPKKSF